MNKTEYLKETKSFLQKKIETIELALRETQESANSDIKSSAGDKHETARAMAHLENERLSGQLVSLQQQIDVLNKINPTIINEFANFGSVVKTNKSIFFLSTGLGKITTDKFTFYAIATNSPVGKNLIGKKIKDSILVGNNTELIHDIF